MGLFDLFKSKKEKSEEPVGSETKDLERLDDVDLSGIDPPETRFTQEYEEFLVSQEAADRGGEPVNAAFPVVSPEGFCARFDRCSTSLIEEPEYCEVCVFYCDRDETCRWPEQVQ